jgi:hypothetical protein
MFAKNIMERLLRVQTMTYAQGPLDRHHRNWKKKGKSGAQQRATPFGWKVQRFLTAFQLYRAQGAGP